MDVDQNIVADDVAVSAAATAADVDDDTEAVSVDADNDASSDDDDDDDDDGVEVIGEDQDYYSEDGQMTTAQQTAGDNLFLFIFSAISVKANYPMASRPSHNP